MPKKFHIPVEPAPPRHRVVGKLGIVDWREDCSSCHNCVKRGCVYGFYMDEADRLRNENGYLDYVYRCKGCLTCIQNCTKALLTRVVNPEYERLGDEHYTPDTILTTWYQAETGKIPVSGSGYGGAFSGAGFDSMWTDMSEIVRPTRDGIHGREYINTGIDIGRKLKHLSFQNGRLGEEPPPLVESPLPVMFDLLPEHQQRGAVLRAVVGAANEIGLLVVVRQRDLAPGLWSRQVVPLIDSVGSIGAASVGSEVQRAALVLVHESANGMARDLRGKNQRQIVAVRVEATAGVADRVRRLVDEGTETIQLVFDRHGRERIPTRPRHMRDVLREIHGVLIKDGTRDQTTLIASGGIALAEHVTKALLCGADLVAVDLPLLIALECRLCGLCAQGGRCPVALEEADLAHATRRIKNLMAAWHSQLIEMMGAMGIREARRLRGETGRAMFFEDLERNTFGRLFGKRGRQNGASA
jgi:ferredoxin